MSPTPIYRVTSMEAFDADTLYTHEITVQPIPEDEVTDLAAGKVSEEGYERPIEMRVNVSEEVFHKLRVGMLYQVAFMPAALPIPEVFGGGQ